MRTIAAVWILLMSLSLAGGERAPAPLAYAWKKETPYRFQYSKTITVRQPDENGKMEERRTEFRATLILEVKQVTGASAACVLRFDSPHLVLPPIPWYSALYDKPEPQADRGKAVAAALAGAIKVARWGVTVDADGTLHVDARTPTGLSDWLKDVSGAGQWRRKQADILKDLIEQDLGLRAETIDREILLCFAPPPEAGAAPLHPLRSKPVEARARDGAKAHVSFTRQAPPGQGAFVVPDLISPARVQATLQQVDTHQGSAIFDTEKGMLDQIEEQYAATLNYAYGRHSLQQEVTVRSELLRLAPK